MTEAIKQPDYLGEILAGLATFQSAAVLAAPTDDPHAQGLLNESNEMAQRILTAVLEEDRSNLPVLMYEYEVLVAKWELWIYQMHEKLPV